LDYAMKRILESDNPLGVGLFIFFSEHSTIPQSLDTISSLLKTRKSKIPMLLATNVVSTSDNDDGEEMSFNDDEMTYDAAEYLQLLNKTVPSSIPVIGYNIFHGMDQVWKRIEGENLLLNFQQLRLISIIELLLTDHENIPNEDARFLEILHRKFELKNPESFTYVVIEQLLKAIEANGKHMLEKSNDKTRGYKNYRLSRIESVTVTEILSDYYVSTTKLSDSRLFEMKKFVEKNPETGILIRAGTVINNENLSGFKRTFSGTNNKLPLFIVGRNPGDRETRSMVSDFVEMMGPSKVMVDLPGNPIKPTLEHKISQPKLSCSGLSCLPTLHSVIFIIFMYFL